MNSKIKISPNFDLTTLAKPVSLETVVTIYEDRIRYWILEPAKILSNYEHGGFSVCYLLASYFESIQIYSTGIINTNSSRNLFYKGFHSVFKDYLESNFSNENILDIKKLMYENFRCGLYHTGLTKSKIILADLANPINAVFQLVEDNSSYKLIHIEIDATKMIYVIENHLDNYLSELRNPNNIEMRDRFLKVFKELYFV